MVSWIKELSFRIVYHLWFPYMLIAALLSIGASIFLLSGMASYLTALIGIVATITVAIAIGYEIIQFVIEHIKNEVMY